MVAGARGPGGKCDLMLAIKHAYKRKGQWLFVAGGCSQFSREYLFRWLYKNGQVLAYCHLLYRRSSSIN